MKALLFVLIIFGGLANFSKCVETDKYLRRYHSSPEPENKFVELSQRPMSHTGVPMSISGSSSEDDSDNENAVKPKKRFIAKKSFKYRPLPLKISTTDSEDGKDSENVSYRNYDLMDQIETGDYAYKLVNGLSDRERAQFWYISSGAKYFKQKMPKLYTGLKKRLLGTQKWENVEAEYISDAASIILRDIYSMYPTANTTTASKCKEEKTHGKNKIISSCTLTGPCEHLSDTPKTICHVLWAIVIDSPSKTYVQGMHNHAFMGIELKYEEEDLFFFIYGMYHTIFPKKAFLGPEIKPEKQVIDLINFLQRKCKPSIDLILASSSGLNELTERDYNMLAGFFSRYVINMLYTVVERSLAFKVIDFVFYFADFNIIGESVLQIMTHMKICQTEALDNLDLLSSIIKPNINYFQKDTIIVKMLNSYCEDYQNSDLKFKAVDAFEFVQGRRNKARIAEICKSVIKFFPPSTPASEIRSISSKFLSSIKSSRIFNWN